ncbi:MAG: ATP-binding domain-containing protein [Lachnospiraceae bacterium]|nr:ATP-binding domain-containing protein [Lachnospiraceae bacterium]
MFNGDVGIIIEIDRFDKSITVKYDNIKIVRYSKDEIDEIDLAYVVTVHKSQGSEYPAVIIPILDTPAQLLNRNLFYTAITRATDCVMIMGDSKKVEEMVKNDFRRRRYTDFLERLNEVMAYID